MFGDGENAKRGRQGGQRQGGDEIFTTRSPLLPTKHSLKNSLSGTEEKHTVTGLSKFKRTQTGVSFKASLCCDACRRSQTKRGELSVKISGKVVLTRCMVLRRSQMNPKVLVAVCGKAYYTFCGYGSFSMAGFSSKSRKRTQKLMVQGADVWEVDISRRRSGIFNKASEVSTLCAVETALVMFFPGGTAFPFGHPGVNTNMNRPFIGHPGVGTSMNRLFTGHPGVGTNMNRPFNGNPGVDTNMNRPFIGHAGVDTNMNRLFNCGMPNWDAILHAKARREATLCCLRKGYSDLVRLNKEYSSLLQKLEAEKNRGELLKLITMNNQSQVESLLNRPVNELNLEELVTLRTKLEESKKLLNKREWELSVKPVSSTPLSAGGSNNAYHSGSVVGDSLADPLGPGVGHGGRGFV
ncbi:hypothetical protein PTKIN_Ptkin08bG0128900 [Pterospermum kingtungense]